MKLIVSAVRVYCAGEAFLAKHEQYDMNRIDETRSALNVSSTVSFLSKFRALFISLPDFYL